MTDRSHRLHGPNGRAITRPGATSPVGDWQRLSAMYEAADGLDAAALQAQIAAWRKEGSPLLDQLLQMLAARDSVQHSDFLGTPAALPEPAVAADPAGVPACGWSAGSRIGPYRLLRHAGSGGMAEVWLAERADGAFNRQVAVKLLFQHADSTRRTSFAQRFARERDILASLHHPNIAALHDAGVTPDGQPWLALEYVEGEPITAWCDRAQLSIAERVALFRQVLLAVQHAHANLVIHRDIKPANILVTRAGEVRLLDFGIAKLQEAGGGALAETELTRHAGRPLTVQYASPEQLSGLPLTTACDVYGLGVVLYELLCGERPYELKMPSAAQVEQAILEAEPRPMSRRGLTDAVASARATTPKALRCTLAPELDAVVLRTLAKRPGDRYGSVDSLLADIDRWRRGEPVLARAPSAAYRLRKFALRHPWGVGLSAFSGAALIGVALLAVMLGLQARKEAETSAAATQFLFDMFRNADPDNSQGIGPAAGLLLEKSREKVLQTMAAQPQLQAELLRKIAEVQLSRGEYAGADRTIADALRLDAASGRRQEEARALAFQALVAFNLGDLRRAGDLLVQSQRRHPNAGADVPFGADFARVRGLLHQAAGELAEAKQRFDESLTKASAVFGPDDSRTMAALNDLAIVEAQAREFEAALGHIEQEVERLQRSPNTSSTDRVNARIFQAAIEQRAGHYRDAQKHLAALDIDCGRWLGDESSYCAQGRVQQAVVLLSMGRAADATHLLPTLARRANNDASPVEQGEALMTACRVQVLSGTASLSSDFCQRVRRMGESGPEVRQPAAMKVAALLVSAEALQRDGRSGDALALLGKVEERIQEDGSMPRSFAGRLLLLRGAAWEALGRSPEAVTALRAALASQAASAGLDHPVTALVGAHLGRVLWSLGQTDEARRLVERAVPIVRDAMGADAPVFEKLVRWQNAMQYRPNLDSRPIDSIDLLV